MKTRFLWLGLAAVLADPVAAQKQPPKVSDDSLSSSGVLTSTLPGTERRFNLKVRVHPNFGDLLDRDYFRLPTTLVYGVTERWEVSERTDLYLAHGLRHERFFRRAGASGVILGTKYNLGDRLWPGWELGFGTNYAQPVGRPPAILTDGLRHTSTFFTFAHRLEKHPGIRVFFAVGDDLVRRTSITGDRDRNQLADNAVGMTAGGVWEKGAFHYTLETSFSTTRGIGSTQRDLVGMRPGILWELPKKLTFYSRGQWLAGLSIHLERGPDGTGFGASGKLQVNFDFKRWWRAVRGKRDAPKAE